MPLQLQPVCLLVIPGSSCCTPQPPLSWSSYFIPLQCQFGCSTANMTRLSLFKLVSVEEG
jgi:hypothetical protein